MSNVSDTIRSSCKLRNATTLFQKIFVQPNMVLTEYPTLEEK